MDARPLAQNLLLQCVKRLNKATGLECAGKVNITEKSHNAYFAAATPERLAAHEYLTTLARQIPRLNIHYQVSGFDEIPILKSIEIGDSRALLNALKIPVLAETIESDILSIRAQIDTAPRWLQTAFQDLDEAWRNNKGVHRFTRTRIDALALGIRFASWLDVQNNLNSDFRSASVKAFGDSKTLEKNLATIAEVLKLSGRHDLSIDYSHAEILAEWGVSKFSPLLRIRGNCSLQLPFSAISTVGAKPYLAMPLEQLSAIVLASPSPYILLIENLSSFERYCREVDDGGVIIYTAGFPSRQWIAPVQRLVSAAKCPVYHWGDIDLGGYQILAYLNRQLGGSVIPYRMFNEHGSSEEIVDLNALAHVIAATTNPHMRRLHDVIVDALDQKQTQYWVEQESLDPISPLEH